MHNDQVNDMDAELRHLEGVAKDRGLRILACEEGNAGWYALLEDAQGEHYSASCKDNAAEALLGALDHHQTVSLAREFLAVRI
jgi:hypothetical protein